MNKKGLSPVVATALLISLVLVLAAIIFLWARAFLPETLQKLEGPIGDACPNIAFVAEYSSGRITIQNNGDIPIRSIEVGIRRGLGSLEYVEGKSESGMTIAGGGTGTFSLPEGTDIEYGDELVVAPVLLGKTNSNEYKAYVCDEEFAQIIQA